MKQTVYIYRFILDPVGYVSDSLHTCRDVTWIRAEVGTTGNMVYIDTSKAYMIEKSEREDRRD